MFKSLKILSVVLLSGLTLLAEQVVYEGFNPEDNASGVRTGFSTPWHRLQGEVAGLGDSIPIAGLDQRKGALLLEKKGEAVSKLNVDIQGTYYGSYRVRSANLKSDSVISLSFNEPNIEELAPKTANLTIMVKGWRRELGALVSDKKTAKTEGGVPIRAKEAYLVLYKVQDGSSGPRLVESWVLNSAQAEQFSKGAFTEEELNAAPLGDSAGEVMQRTSLKPKKSVRLSLAKGDLIACIAKFNPKTVFDEIRISTSSLREAAGVSSGPAGKNQGKVKVDAPEVSSLPATDSIAVQASPKADGTGRPDIVFILLDDLRYDALSFMDHPYVETPQIDRLRARGANMKNAFVTTSICCPSRATFLTGTYASQHGVIDNETSEYDPDLTPPVSKYLQEAGYRTAMIGKWHMGFSGKPRPYFNEWLSFDGQGKYNDPEFIYADGSREQVSGYTTDLLTDRAIDFIDRQPKDRPYFLMLSHKAVHEPFRPAPRHKNAFGWDTKDPEPVSWSDTFEGKPKWLRRQRVRDVRWTWRTREVEEEELPESIPLEPWKSTKKYVKQLRCLAAVDEGVGKLIDTLEARGTLDNTLIVFTSDNGYFHMEHRRWDKRLAYEESMRIPMVVVYPGKIKPGSTVSQLVANVDFAPTVLSYAGVSIPEQMQGADMRPLFEGQVAGWRDSIFYEYWTDLVHAIPTMRAVRDDRFKLIEYPGLDDIDELYDLEKDPHEMTNLVMNPAYEGLHDKMEQLLEKKAEQVGWSRDVFPKNLPRVRGPKGQLLDLQVKEGDIVDASNPDRDFYRGEVAVEEGVLRFNGVDDVIKIPFDPEMDPSGWPYRISVDFKADKDGVIASQASPGYGFKLFVQDGRPGVSIMCKTWIPSRTTIDGPDVVLDKWTNLAVEIDYNRLSFWIDGDLVDVMDLPLPFKAKTKAPLIVGAGAQNPIYEAVPHNKFKGQIRNLVVQRVSPE